MIKKKILVCGSAGFLMSNFIRYLLYMTKDFEIVSVDKLYNLNSYKNLYIHNNHKFYIGDIADEYFVDRILYVENPDIIVNGCFYTVEHLLNINNIINGTANLLRAKAPLIQICGCTEKSYDSKGFWNFISKYISSNGETCIEVPNVFGRRQKLTPYFSVPWIHHELIKNKSVHVREEIVPWVFAEDISSLIWYIIENNEKGHIKMPELGKISEKEIAEYIKNMYELHDATITVENPSIDNDYLVTKYDSNIISGWQPDSKNIYSSLEKTVKWFDINRWAFNL